MCGIHRWLLTWQAQWCQRTMSFFFSLHKTGHRYRHFLFYIQWFGERDSTRNLTYRSKTPFKKTKPKPVFFFFSHLTNFKWTDRSFPTWCIFLKRMRYLPQDMLSFITSPLVWSDKWCCSSAVQDLNECLSELNIKGGVYDGIYSTIHIAQPGESVIHLGRNLAFGAVGVQDMCDEKRQPAYNEYTWGKKKKN